MRSSIALWLIPVLGLPLAVVSVSGAGGAEAGQAAKDYSGTYYVAIGMHPLFTMEVVHSGGAVEFSLTGSGMVVEGTGSVSGRDMSLTAALGEIGDFSAVVEFAEDGWEFEGTWEVVGGQSPIQGTITGTQTEWQNYDVDLHGVPRFVGADAIELGKIVRVSKFRSGAGHDYSDELESCRSMKHYYHPREGVERQSVRVFSPVTGTVIGTTDEWDGPELWKGTAIGIRPEGHEAFYVVLFHIDLRSPFRVGDSVVAGQELGTSEKISGTVTDVAVGLHTPYGHRRISFFEAMPDHVFARYRARGAVSRSQFIFTKEERDADPLTCDGEQFADEGNLDNWVTLTEGLVAPRHPRGRRVPD
jgi:hypothetical protein